MTHNEHVKKALEEAILFVDSRGYGGVAHIMHDALELLKEQEPVKAIPTRMKVVRTYNDIEYNYCCGGCNSFLLDRWVACPVCGKAVKWDA